VREVETGELLEYGSMDATEVVVVVADVAVAPEEEVGRGTAKDDVNANVTTTGARIVEAENSERRVFV
jgi:hypothetical protein